MFSQQKKTPYTCYQHCVNGVCFTIARSCVFARPKTSVIFVRRFMRQSNDAKRMEGFTGFGLYEATHARHVPNIYIYVHVREYVRRNDKLGNYNIIMASIIHRHSLDSNVIEFI